ncbi:hypothetical protein M3O57_01880 [Xanthomonas nasturtii]|uniref:hypothetical protein n=1 Tax=Xanthomonas nasturtii TaxID=1843581 RepID=UPI002013751B|nr:hypothetical protein [Xanthomonas nasturtii]MCL1579601.1 hypothetical protein [Xanthomonas nasturtii]MCL1589211.1 hypothetical protein [Xanthomonas nasturtii]WVL54007.1 hypothetical protein M3O59_006410 [Xanthomonas nasturtii]
MLAWQVTSGWALAPAGFVVWLCIALVAAGIDRLFTSPPVEVPAAPPAAENTKDSTGPAHELPRLPKLEAAARRGVEDSARATSVRQWRRHIADVVPYEEERYPRQGICTTVQWFLRAGDQLVLAFHPDAHGSTPCTRMALRSVAARRHAIAVAGGARKG